MKLRNSAIHKRQKVPVGSKPKAGPSRSKRLIMLAPLRLPSCDCRCTVLRAIQPQSFPTFDCCTVRRVFFTTSCSRYDFNSTALILAWPVSNGSNSCRHPDPLDRKVNGPSKFPESLNDLIPLIFLSSPLQYTLRTPPVVPIPVQISRTTTPKLAYRLYQHLWSA